MYQSLCLLNISLLSDCWWHMAGQTDWWKVMHKGCALSKKHLLGGVRSLFENEADYYQPIKAKGAFNKKF